MDQINLINYVDKFQVATADEYLQEENYIKLKKESTNESNILHSFFKMFDEFKDLLEILNADYDVIIMSEVWILKHEFIIDGGRFNQNDGTLIYVKNEYPVSLTHEKFNEVTSP